MRTSLVLIALLCPLTAPFVKESAACSCLPRSPCQIFNSAGAIFAGDVIDVQQDDGEVVARVQVQHVWKGQVGPIVSLRTDSRWSSCDVHFAVGERRLVIARGSGDNFYTDACLGGGVLPANATLSALPPVPGRLAGRVGDIPIERFKRSQQDGSDPTVPVRSGRIWFDTPSGRRETTFDSNGRFQFDNVEPGEGTLYAEAPAYEVRPGEFSLSGVTDCEDVFLIADPAGRLAGSVVGADGTGVAGVHLELRSPIDPSVSYPVATHAITDKAGRFEFRMLHAGDYVLGINVDGSPSARNPYATVYYPGVADSANATVLSVGEGAPELEAPFILPPALPTRTLSVSVTCRDGSVPPVVAVEASVSGRSMPAEYEMSRDSGTATIRLLGDVAYGIEIRASFPTPDYDTLLRVRVLEKLHVEAGSDIPPVTVVAPFVSCARRAQ